MNRKIVEKQVKEFPEYFKNVVAYPENRIDCVSCGNNGIHSLKCLVPDLIESRESLSKLREALEFYADPETYHAIGIFPDKPCGLFIEDFSKVPESDYDRVMPGKRAREALKSSKGE